MMFEIRQPDTDDTTEWDDATADAYVNGLMEAFAESPEGTAWSEANGPLGWAATMVDFAIEHCGVTPACMSQQHLEVILFNKIPQEMPVQPAEAYFIVGEIRAFWKFVERQYGVAHASRFVSLLDSSSERRLRGKLSASPPTKVPTFQIAAHPGADLTIGPRSIQNS